MKEALKLRRRIRWTALALLLLIIWNAIMFYNEDYITAIIMLLANIGSAIFTYRNLKRANALVDKWTYYENLRNSAYRMNDEIHKYLREDD